jgi:transcription elongation GreA/GreB family factor
MENAMTFAEAESEFVSLLDSKPLQVNKLLAVIHSASVKNNQKDDEWSKILAQELIEAGDFHGLYLLFKSRLNQFASALGAAGIAGDLKRACKDRLILSFIETVPFASQPLEASVRQLDTLLELAPGTQVIDKTWGFGIVKRLDHFYKRITVDFSGKRGHNLTFQTASESLTRAARDHILTVRGNNPDEIGRLIREEPGEFVKMTVRSFGKMPIPKLEATLTEHGFLSAAEWKSFWESARKALRNDPLVSIPAKRTECIEILSIANSYDQNWFARLQEEKDAHAILKAVIEIDAALKPERLDETQRATISNRLIFAVQGAENTDSALYARLIVLCRRHGINPAQHEPSNQRRELEDPHAHLWGENRFIKAAEALPVRDVAGMVEFLLTEGASAEARLLEALPLMPFNLLNETLQALRDRPETASVCRSILLSPKAPPTLINWIFRNRSLLTGWDLPPLIELLHHAVVIVETNLSGEDLRMQNALKKFFSNAKWLEEVFGELSEIHRQLLFERIQASPAWDSAAHRTLIARMLKLDPNLAARKRLIDTGEAAPARLTSWRSLRARQMQYKHLTEVEMPRNSNDIAVARSYGDLRENFEYQAAKDYQRQLLQRQAEMQLELEIVKGTDFEGVCAGKVAPGTTVALKLADGAEKTFTILGEWDRDEQLNIISNKTTMAMSLFGKKTGDSAIIPSSEGEIEARVTDVRPLSDEIRAWIAATPTTP